MASVELRLVSAYLKVTIERRGRALRRARRFGRPARYDTLAGAVAAIDGPGALKLVYEPVSQTIAPMLMLPDDDGGEPQFTVLRDVTVFKVW